MGYTSYYLYQKYIKIGSQDYIPCYPPEFSISGDSQNPMPLVVKVQQDPLCGYFDPIYRWQQEDISENYTCSGGNKYYVEVYQVSYDSGYTWQNVVPEETRQGSIYETGSSDCIEYRWVNMDISTDWICDACPDAIYRWYAIPMSGEYICSGTSKMAKEYRQVSYDSGSTWQNVVPEETRAGELIETDSYDCGYVSYRWVTIQNDYWCSGTTKMTKEKKQQTTDGTNWTDVSPAEIRSGNTVIEYNSEDCGYIAPQYRTLNTATTCVGFDKYVLTEYQVSYDSGTTWTTTATSATTLIEADSPDCGYVPPTPSYKFIATYPYGSTSSAECDSTSAITAGEITSTSLRSIEIGDCVTSIGSSAFTNCSGLTSVYIPSGVTRIWYYAFRKCSGLTSVTISSDVTSLNIYSAAFRDCSRLTSIDIPSGVTGIGNSAFTHCSGLTSINMPSGIGHIAEDTFNSCISLSGITIPSGVKNIYGSAFQNCRSLTSIDMPSGVTFIGPFTFSGCSSLTSIDIPSGVTKISNRTFANCSSLTSVTFAAGSQLSQIAVRAFESCSGLTSIDIPSGVTEIGVSAFTACKGLTSITIPSGVTSIGSGMCSGCTSLTSITCLATTPPTLGSSAFNSTNNCPIYVPATSLQAYKSASGWSTYSSRIQAIPT